MMRSISNERLQVLRGLVEEGRTISYIHREYGFNYSTVRKHFPDYRTGSHHRKSTEQILKDNKDVIDQLAEERAPGGHIADVVGLSATTLKKYRPDLMWTRKEAAAHAAMVSAISKIGNTLKEVH